MLLNIILLYFFLLLFNLALHCYLLSCVASFPAVMPFLVSTCLVPPYRFYSALINVLGLFIA